MRMLGDQVRGVHHGMREASGLILQRRMSYVADHEEDNHLCRIYGATLNGEHNRPDLPVDTKWFSAPALDPIVTPCPFLSEAVRQWLDDDAELIRGKGKSELQCLPTDGLNQYAD